MFVKIIFTFKNSGQINANSFKVMDFIKDALADKLSSNEFAIVENQIRIKKKKWVDISCNVVRFDKLILLELTTATANVGDFKSLETIWDCITKTKLRNDVIIHKVFDEPSHILCVRLYKPLALFERNLRRLIYEIVAKVYGGEWFRKTIEELVSEHQSFKAISQTIKSKANQDKANYMDVALEELAYEEVIKYLFERTTLKPYKSIMEIELSDENLDKLSKEDIETIIRSNRPQSLWERLFSEYKRLDDLQNEINDIQALRNKVMHAKTMRYSEYMELNHLLKKWNPLIEEACQKNETKKYGVDLSVNVISSLNNYLEMVSSAASLVGEFLSTINFDVIRDSLMQIADSVSGAMGVISNIDFPSIIPPMIALSDLMLPPTDLSPTQDEEERKDEKEDDEDDGDDVDDG